MTQLGGSARDRMRERARRGREKTCLQSAASTHPSRQPCGHPSIARHRHRQDLGHRNVKRPPVKWPKCCPLLTVVKLGLLACQAEANCQLQTGQTSTASEQQLAWHIQTHIITAHTHTHSYVVELFYFAVFFGFWLYCAHEWAQARAQPPTPFPSPSPSRSLFHWHRHNLARSRC